MNRIDLKGGDFYEFYAKKLEKFGDSAKGVGYKNEAAQIIRFDQIIKIIGDKENFTINDLGCGTGALFQYLMDLKMDFKHYYGYDLYANMIDICSEKYSQANSKFSIIDEYNEMEIADFTVANGVFNTKQKVGNAVWQEYIIQSLRAMDVKSKLGFSFNLLTSYSDKDKMEDILYYGDPCFYFDYCKKNFSSNVALLHDYNEYDFTILVRK